MRVLYLTDSLSDLDGVGRYAVRLIHALQAQRPDLEAKILLARKHRPTSSEVPGHWDVDVALPPDYFFHMKPTRFWPSYAKATAATWRAASGCDLVHAIKDYPHSWIGLTAARLRKLPCVATAHGTYSVQPLLDQRHEARARKLYRGLSGLISVSGYTARRLEELLGPDELPRDRHWTIPNAVNAEAYTTPLHLRGGRPWHRVPFTLSIGELKERKGHHLALEAWCAIAERFPEWHHFVVGKGSGDPYHRSLQARVEHAGLEERVHFVGNVTEEEKVDLLQRAGVFIHTPVTASGGGFEGFGIVYLEAGAAGTACLGTLDSGAEDALVNERTGLLVEPQAEAVRAALERLLGDELLRERLAFGGREHARKSTWEVNAERVLAVYDAALKSAGAARGESGE